MKIGIMLRHYDQHGGGVWVYTRNLLREMLSLDPQHEFVLIYRDPKFIGAHGDGRRIREVAVPSPHALLWDQVAVKRVAELEKLDLLFNPKYSIPLNVRCPTAWVCHGLDWYVAPEWSRWFDRLSHRFLIPRYAHKARAIIAVSNTTKSHLQEFLGVDAARIHAVYHGVDAAFSKPVESAKKEAVRRSFRLPERFFLYVGQIYPAKNFARLLEAYAKVGPQLGVHLVVAGQHTWKCRHELARIDEMGLSSWVLQTGWIDRETLPVFYRLAEAFVFPSLYESFGIPMLEAMSSGCPVVTSDRYATRELGEGAAVLVDPEDSDSIASGMQKIIEDRELRRKIIEAGRARASGFSWRKCAEQTLRALVAIAGNEIPAQGRETNHEWQDGTATRPERTTMTSTRK